MMRFGLAAHFISILSTITAHPSKQNALDSEPYRRDEDVSAIELDSLEISSLWKRYFNPSVEPAYYNLNRKDLISDFQLTPVVDDPENALSVAVSFDDESCPDRTVSREGKEFCPGETKLMTPSPGGEDELRLPPGLKPEPQDVPKPLPEKPSIPGPSLLVVPSEPLLLPEGSLLLELLPSEDRGSPGDEKCTRLENPLHVCCEGRLAGLGEIELNKFYQTIDNCNLCKRFYSKD